MLFQHDLGLGDLAQADEVDGVLEGEVGIVGGELADVFVNQRGGFIVPARGMPGRP